MRDDRPEGSRAPPAVWYRYSRDRKGERPREHLAGCTRILQADAFSGYDALYKLDSSPIAEEALRRKGRCMLSNARFAAGRQTCACLRVSSARHHCSLN
ncbi:transposase [Paraburkholderia sp. LEh10]|uniref:IS66 family transposase n=1 Tax=Paraburkholderia sp. LEh10 TaxID=2821353 RepID=UPI0028B1159C|nr:transposase [Paraburkholderia sp. LEh10]